MLLTDTTIRNAKPKDRLYKLRDGDGLFVHVHPNASVISLVGFLCSVLVFVDVINDIS